MNSIFRDDITRQETSFFLKGSFLLPKYLGTTYSMNSNDVKKIINEVEENSSVHPANGKLIDSEGWVTESLMKKCFSKCKQFVLEDWVDYDELDCTMKCTLLHKKSLNLLREVQKNI